jgi:transcription antitermination protein NusB
MKSKKLVVEENPFPLSKKRVVEGNRHIAREKVLQILSAYQVMDSNRQNIFNHIFYREFNLHEQETSANDNTTRILHPEEVKESEADTPIQWRDKDVEFAHQLLQSALNHEAQFDEIIERLAKNWELERIALIDRQLLRMGLAEILSFVDIPPRVTLNEIIELAKSYSTDKSNIFINGILDAAVDELRDAGKVHKEGRGLQEISNSEKAENDANALIKEESGSTPLEAISDINSESELPTPTDQSNAEVGTTTLNPILPAPSERGQ